MSNYLVIEGRSVCKNNCGYDKSKIAGVDTPCNYQDIKKVFDDVTTFKPHTHSTRVSHRIYQSLEETSKDA